MDEAALRALFEDVQRGELDPDEAVRQLRWAPFVDLGFAVVDHHRQLRQGLPEAIYGPGKSVAHVVAVVGELLAGGDGPVVLSRASTAQADAASAAHPGATRTGVGSEVETVVWRPAGPRPEQVAVVAAGTADLPVADECAAVLIAFGLVPTRVTDVGVAGLHRLVPAFATLAEADAVVVVAGMEGALASVVGGLTSCPVVAVPTSTGYGAGLEGVTALLGMLSSCASGVSVVGIDNGFGAACAVARALTPSRVVAP